MRRYSVKITWQHKGGGYDRSTVIDDVKAGSAGLAAHVALKELKARVKAGKIFSSSKVVEIDGSRIYLEVTIGPRIFKEAT